MAEKLDQYCENGFQVFDAFKEQARIGLEWLKVFVEKKDLLNLSKNKPLTPQQKLKLKACKLKIKELRQELTNHHKVIAQHNDLSSKIMLMIRKSNTTLLELKREELLLWLVSSYKS